MRVTPARNTEIRNSGISGQYYRYPSSTVSTFAPTLNRLYVTPLWMRVGSVDRISVFVQAAAAATGVIRLGVYLPGADGAPRTLLFDAGTVASDSTGAKEITVSQGIPEGLLWVAFCGQTTVTSLNVYGVSSTSVALYPFSGPTIASQQYRSFYQNSVSGALPSSFTFDGSLVEDAPPVVWLRRV